MLRLLLEHGDFLIIDISQDSAATRLRWGGRFKYDFIRGITASPQDDSRNSLVSIETRFRPSTYFYLRGSPAGARRGEAITGRTRRRSRPMTGPHRLRTINIAGTGVPKTAGGGYGGARPGKHNGHRPPDDGPGNHHLPPHRRTPLDNDNRLTSLEGWAREMAISGRVSGAVAHLSKRRRAARRRDAIADRMLGIGDHRPAVGRRRTIGRHSGRSAHLMSALTRL